MAKLVLQGLRGDRSLYSK